MGLRISKITSAPEKVEVIKAQILFRKFKNIYASLYFLKAITALFQQLCQAKAFREIRVFPKHTSTSFIYIKPLGALKVKRKVLEI